MTKDEVLQGLKSGRTLICDRRDAPLLPWLLELADAGTLTTEIVEYDEQSTAIKFRWAAEREGDLDGE